MQQEAAHFHVAISGASFAGLALACALSDALGPGFKIALIDRIPSTSARADVDGMRSIKAILKPGPSASLSAQASASPAKLAPEIATWK